MALRPGILGDPGNRKSVIADSVVQASRPRRGKGWPLLLLGMGKGLDQDGPNMHQEAVGCPDGTFVVLAPSKTTSRRCQYARLLMMWKQVAMGRKKRNEEEEKEGLYDHRIG